MPVVLIWEPDGKENLYGHAALATEKYYMSFWPDGIIGQDLNKFKAGASSVKACIVYFPNYDMDLMARVTPKQYHIAIATDEDIDRVYEEFLRDNGVSPSDVTKEEGRKKYRQGVWPSAALSTTRYNYLPSLYSFKNPPVVTPEWFKSFFTTLKVSSQVHSCTTFVYSIIEVADPRTGMTFDRMRNADIAEMVKKTGNIALTVPNFQYVVEKFYVEDAKGKRSDCPIS